MTIKGNRLIYWISTLWLSLGMVSTAGGQLLHMKKGQGGLESLTHLGYPSYLLTLLGVWKVMGVVAILVPKFRLLKEWAYAGFFFAMSGAAFSHLESGDSMIAAAPSLFLLTLTAVSWYSRPSDRTLVPVNP